jgi:hypothetical protein
VHHCTMSAEDAKALLQGQHFSAFHGRCSQYPEAVAPSHPAPYLLAGSVLLTPVLSQADEFRQVEAWARAAQEGARHKRGPPAPLV